MGGAAYLHTGPPFSSMDTNTQNRAPIAAPPARSRGHIFTALFENIFLLLGLTLIAYCLEVIDLLSGNALDQFGIRPRHLDSITGIFAAHWLHGGFRHLVSNTVPFLMLGGFVLLGGRAMFWKVTCCVGLLGGGLLWLLGGSGIHLGASMVIFGYLGFLLTRGIFEKSPLWIAVSVITLLLYNGMLFGVLPGQPGVSWEGHLVGFLAGIAAARFLVPKHRSLYASGA